MPAERIYQPADVVLNNKRNSSTHPPTRGDKKWAASAHENSHTQEAAWCNSDSDVSVKMTEDFRVVSYSEFGRVYRAFDFVLNEV